MTDIIEKKQTQVQIEQINTFQTNSFNAQAAADYILATNQSRIRFEQVTTDQQAAIYIQDLGLADLKDIKNPQEKAYHLFGFYDYLTQQKQAAGYEENLIKLFQLAIFYDDNYVYRYYLALFEQQLGFNEDAIQNLNSALLKIKNNQTRLYQSLANDIQPTLIQSQIAQLARQLLPPPK